MIPIDPPTSSLMPVPPPFTRHFAALAADYDVALCDVWGVVVLECPKVEHLRAVAEVDSQEIALGP